MTVERKESVYHAFTPLPSTTNEQPTIVIIDDDELVEVVLREALDDLGDLYFARTVISGLAQIRRHKPSLILLDINLPDGNGVDVCRQIKHDQKLKHVPIIFMTNTDPMHTESEALVAGGIDYLHKPINTSTWRQRVINHLVMVRQYKTLKTRERDLDVVLSHLPVHVTYWTDDLALNFSNLAQSRYTINDAPLEKGVPIDEVFEARLVEKIRLAIGDGISSDISFEYKLAFGNVSGYFRVTIATRIDEFDQHGYILTLTDITNLKLVQNTLESERNWFRVTLKSIGDGVITIDKQGTITFINDVAERLTAYCKGSALGKSVETVLRLREAKSQKVVPNPGLLAMEEQRILAMPLNCQLVDKNGQVFRVEDSAAPIRDEAGQINGAVIVFHDTTEQVAMSVEMTHLIHHDALTGLPNRILMQDRLEQTLQSCRYTKNVLGLILVDIDHFKYVNESLGHEAGDDLIKRIAQRIESVMIPGSTLSRVGGDEFFIITPPLEDSARINSMCERIAFLLHKPFVIDEQNYVASVSIGVSIFPEDAEDLQQLMRHADVAMYRAKHEGRNRYCFFSPILERKVLLRTEIESRLREAIEEDEVDVYFQPKVNFQTGKLSSVEALCRVKRKDGSFISPGDFIPIAEETQLIFSLSERVFERCIKLSNQWRAAGHDFPIAINVSPKHLAHEGFVNEFASLLKLFHASGSSFEFEITEGALLSEHEKFEMIFKEVKALGISLAIDDFGTGFSNFSYLKKFNIDVLKIDQSFVKDMLSLSGDRNIIQAMISMAHSLGLQTVAEGVETQEQYEALKQMGCDYAQGYWLDAPLPAEAFEAHWLSRSAN